LMSYLGNLQKLIGVNSVRTENSATAEFPQYFADRFGWEIMVEEIAKVYNGLDGERKKACVILTGNYGEAGAVDLFGDKYGLPSAVCGHLSYYFWGPGSLPGDIAISVGIPYGDLAGMYDTIERKSVIFRKYSMPRENGMQVYLCSNPRTTLQAIWPKAKHFD
jgi:hypothetical protein